MTGKQFTGEFDKQYSGVYDDGEQLTNFEVVDLLNKLSEDNAWLHKMNEDAIGFIDDNFDLNRIFTDRELNDICIEKGLELSEKGIKIHQLEKENEQLKHKLQQQEMEYATDLHRLAEEKEQLKRRNKKLEKHLRKFYSDEEWKLREALGDFE